MAATALASKMLIEEYNLPLQTQQALKLTCEQLANNQMLLLKNAEMLLSEVIRKVLQPAHVAMATAAGAQLACVLLAAKMGPGLSAEVISDSLVQGAIAAMKWTKGGEGIGAPASESDGTPRQTTDKTAEIAKQLKDSNACDQVCILNFQMVDGISSLIIMIDLLFLV